MIRSLAHVCIKSQNPEKTAELFCGVLGMKRVFNFMKEGKIFGYYMQAANDTFVEVFQADKVDKLGYQALTHFCLQTDHIETLRALLVERGYSPEEIKLGADNSHQFWLKDVDGVDLEC